MAAQTIVPGANKNQNNSAGQDSVGQQNVVTSMGPFAGQTIGVPPISTLPPQGTNANGPTPARKTSWLLITLFLVSLILFAVTTYILLGRLGVI